MRLQIKTLSQKSIIVEIDESKTVYELKKELSLYPDVGVRPELQKLIYAGKILSNEDELSAYNIDVKKFLVVMILKQPLEGEPLSPAAATTSAVQSEKTAATPESKTSSETAEFKTPTTPGASTPQQQQQQQQMPVSTPQSSGGDSEAAGSDSRAELVQQIVSMGYPEGEVRRALSASFYNAERAIEYLIEGIPTEPSTPEGGGFVDFTDDSAEMSPFEVFRSDPLFRNLRRAIQQHPDLIDDAIQRVGEANPAILSLIQENQQDFLSMLIEGSEDDFDDEDEESS